MEQGMFRKTDLEAFFKALKESCNTLGNTLGYSYTAHAMSSTTERIRVGVQNLLELLLKNQPTLNMRGKVNLKLEG
ncbi:hypothetical protein F2Q70_00044762 [Brassica cretica]|uniref:Uncharacterized protein n=1 Tax=Brassica cretica TaxID=69181 RepID=A0A8S9KDJ9_BRACR|nr:hypothetical protein F2Q70_00044762 [Brassica cretica]